VEGRQVTPKGVVFSALGAIGDLQAWLTMLGPWVESLLSQAPGLLGWRMSDTSISGTADASTSMWDWR
jgi:hypothetical protein